MPDTRKHRGPHPADAELFACDTWPTLRQAVEHMSWLLSCDYPPRATLKLVGDRFRLTERQRLAVMRSSCSDQARQDRWRRRFTPRQVAGTQIAIDGFNVLTTIEAALAGGVVLRGRDGCDRDLASMHGSYRKVKETRPALEHIGGVLAELDVAGSRWLLDRPVSNSGRLSTLIRELADDNGWNWLVELVNDPDAVLRETSAVVASSDSAVLDGCAAWFNLAREVIQRRIPQARVLSFEPIDDDGQTETTKIRSTSEMEERPP